MSAFEKEKVTQNRLVKLLGDTLGYTYLGDWHDRNNQNIEQDYLGKYLQRSGYSSTLINKAINEFVNLAGNQQLTLYDLNKAVYSALRYGVKKTLDPRVIYMYLWMSVIEHNQASCIR